MAILPFPAPESKPERREVAPVELEGRAGGSPAPRVLRSWLGQCWGGAQAACSLLASNNCSLLLWLLQLSEGFRLMLFISWLII